ncbi:hypothetical protein CA984_18330 [Streptosporangium minutum]|uniref:Uncharacterized protein n=1 Tax=Streptosporangium minutum TaxID=569862 RepID=A0A243RL06_9ACTN|nr:hypothetical protein CA984_18330 [Streptosporangium minutum]
MAEVETDGSGTTGAEVGGTEAAGSGTAGSGTAGSGTDGSGTDGSGTEGSAVGGVEATAPQVPADCRSRASWSTPWVRYSCSSSGGGTYRHEPPS